MSRGAAGSGDGALKPLGRWGAAKACGIVCQIILAIAACAGLSRPGHLAPTW